MQQVSSSVLMVRPAAFIYNVQTALSNAFQQKNEAIHIDEIEKIVLEEFDGLVAKLRENNVNVIVVNDTPIPPKPDAIFPNNWLITHVSGIISLFPMEAENRRAERRPDILQALEKDFRINQVVDFSEEEKNRHYLEGTGSMVLDHENKVAYACLSPRTHKKLFKRFCKKFGYLPQIFLAFDQNGTAIYHTNVIMCVGSQLAVLCTSSIKSEDERQTIVKSLEDTGHEIIDISFDQMHHFAGNMLQLRNSLGEDLLVMSTQAFESLNEEQLAQIEKYAKTVHSPLYTIEGIGGGSARCMMAEIFLPPKS